MRDLTGLPGAELIEPGLEDLHAGRSNTASALLVAIAARRLRNLGLDVPEDLPDDPELRLYRHLRATRPHDAYSHYNALIRRLISFSQAAEREHWARVRREARSGN